MTIADVLLSKDAAHYECKLLRYRMLRGSGDSDTMPEGSDSGDVMDYGFPVPPQSDISETETKDRASPVQKSSDAHRVDLLHPHEPHPQRLATTIQEQIEDALRRLSPIEEADSAASRSSRSVSHASNARRLNLPTALTASTPFVRQALMPSSANNPSLYAPSTPQHAVQGQPKFTTNRKILKVRQNYRPSHLRTEVQHNLDTQVNNGGVTSHGINYRSHLPAPAHRNYLHPAVYANVRDPSTWSVRAAEDKYRFPSRQTLLEQGTKCSSYPCSALNSQYGSPVQSPFGTPTRSPVTSAGPSSLKSGYGRDAVEGSKVDADIISCTGYAPTAHGDDVRNTGCSDRPHGQQAASETDTSKHPAICSNVPSQSHNTHEQEKDNNGAQSPSHAQSVASTDVTVRPRRYCALFARLKKVFSKRKPSDTLKKSDVEGKDL